jgi:hypothetical protein
MISESQLLPLPSAPEESSHTNKSNKKEEIENTADNSNKIASSQHLLHESPSHSGGYSPPKKVSGRPTKFPRM